MTVYSKPGCAQCTATTTFLRGAALDFEVIDITGDADAMALVVSWGAKSVPVVVSGDQRWSGFRPDLIAQIP